MSRPRQYDGGPIWPTSARKAHQRRRNRKQVLGRRPGPRVMGIAAYQERIVRDVLAAREQYGHRSEPPLPPVIDGPDWTAAPPRRG